MNKVCYGLFLNTSSEVIWPRKRLNSMHGLKSTILVICQKSANWQDWPCPVSAALQNRPQDFFFLFIFSFIFLNMKPLSELAPGILVIQIPIQAVWNIMPPSYGKHTFRNFLARFRTVSRLSPVSGVISKKFIFSEFGFAAFTRAWYSLTSLFSNSPKFLSLINSS